MWPIITLSPVNGLQKPELLSNTQVANHLQSAVKRSSSTFGDHICIML